MSKPTTGASVDAQFNSAKVKELLEKTKHYDADERFMATKDLLEQVRLVSGSVEATLQAPLRECILRLLDDKNSDVSTMAVKCLSQLSTRLSQEHLIFIVDKLADIIVDPAKTAARDIVTDGLQTLIASINDEAGAHIAPKLIQSLLRGLTQKPGAEVDCEMACLTIVKNLLGRFGNDVTEQHGALMSALLTLLKHPHDAVRKRASITLGPLVTVLDDTLFEKLMSTLIDELKASATPGTYIQSISAICRSAGVKVGPYLPAIVPKLESLCLTNSSAGGRARHDDEEEDEQQLELWEQSLRALEAITLRCPNKVTAYVPKIVALATQLSTYDPLYTYEDEDDMVAGKKAAADAGNDDDAWGDDGGDGGDGWGDDGDANMDGGNGGGWGNDDEAAAAAVATASSDNSWKVRRAAVCLLTAFIRARSDILKEYYSSVCSHLLSRFKERDAAVKEEILLCMRDLLRESVVTGKAGAAAAASLADKGPASSHGGVGSDAMEDEPPTMAPTFLRTRSSYETLDVKLPEIVAACEKLFRGTLDSRAQRATFALLSELVRVRHGGLDEYLQSLLPPILKSIEKGRAGAEAEASADALRLLRSIIELHKFEKLQPHLSEVSRVLCDAVSRGPDSNKVDALGVVASVAKLLASKKQSAIAQALFQVVYAEFILADVPLPAKLATISALASILSYVGEADLDRSAVSAKVMPVLLQRLHNDSTVQPTLRALTRVANLSDALDWSPLIAASSDLVHLCRKTSHHLKNDVVRCLEAIMRRSATTHAKRPSEASFTNEQLAVIIKEIAPLISDQDLHLAHLVFDLCSTALAVGSNKIADLVAQLVLPAALRIMLSPRLQGVALTSLIRFLQACVETSKRAGANPQSQLEYTKLLGLLLAQVPASGAAPAGSQLNRAAYMSVAQCVAGTTERASDAQASSTVSKFVQEIVNTKPSDLSATSQLALLVLGEMGRKRDLSQHAGLNAACLQAFDSKDEQVRSAAAFALGNIAVANLASSLPKLLQLTQERLATHGYLLFSALKEIILAHSNDAAGLVQFQGYVDALLPLLLANVGHAHESTRAMVAECLGRLTVIAPPKLLNPLEKLVLDKRPEVRGAAIISLRFCLHPLMEYGVLYQHLESLLTPLLTDVDLDVRRNTLLTINAIARINVEALPRDLLYQRVLPTLYLETKVKPELRREIDYGAFKKIVDEGKPLRLSAYALLQTLLEVTPHRIDLPEFIAAVKQGIRDEEDVQLLAYQVFIELARFHGSALLEVIDQLPTLIMDSVKKYISEAKSKEPEQALDILRAIVRALLVFNKVPGVELCTKYMHFFRQVQATSLMKTLIDEANRAGF